MKRQILFLSIKYLLLVFFATINQIYAVFIYTIEEAKIFSETEMQPHELEKLNGLIKYQKTKNESFFAIKIRKKPEIHFYSSVEEFKKNTTLDWHYGGVYTKGKIYVQPFKILERKNSLEHVLFHEYCHFFIDQTFPDLPLFMNEGLVTFLTGKRIKENPPLLYESMLMPELFRKPADFEVFLSSSANFVKYLLFDVFQEREEFITFLKNMTTNDIKKLYRDYYNETSEKIRVWINPRGEKRLHITFTGACKVISGKKTTTNSFYEDISLEVLENKLYLNHTKGSEFFLCFHDGFHIESKELTRKSYRGNLAIYLTNNVLYVINILPLEEYLYSVVASEMPTTNKEALKVQAVLSRSLALVKKELRKNELYDVVSLTSDQSYQGKNWENLFSIEAVQQTDREVIFYNANVIYPYYSSTCGGHTAFSSDVWNRDLPYTQSIPCFYSHENLCSGSPHFQEWERVISKEELSEIMGFQVYNFQVEKTNQYGRVRYIKINEKVLLFDEVKKIIAKKKGWAFLKSNLLQIEKKSDGKGFLIRGRGLGHGVGLCQYGAIELSRKNNYQDVICFYFNNVEVKKAGYGYVVFSEY